jgi:membrane protein implicated in regulation of membrane protease activity
VDAEVLWLVLAAVLIVVELLTLTIALGMLGVAALLTRRRRGAGRRIVLQSIAFGVTSLGLLVFVRPPVQRMLTSRDDASTDPRALSGSTPWWSSGSATTPGRSG